MRHRKSGRKLGRTSTHRKATLRTLCTSLLRHKRIRTTLAKAKETRMVVEKIITRAKNAQTADTVAKNVHARRVVASYLTDRAVVKELFTEIAAKVSSRPGGYTRITKLGQRHGDGGEVAIIELVDYTLADTTAKEEVAEKQPKKKKKAATKPASEVSAS